MRAAASAWALLSMQLHEPRNPPSILPWVVAVSFLKQQKEKQSSVPVSPGYNWVLLRCRNRTWLSVTNVISPFDAKLLRVVASDAVPFLPTRSLFFFFFFCQLISASRKLSLPQFTRLSQVSTLFECDSNPNHARTIISAYLTAIREHRFEKKWICLAKTSADLLEKLKDRRTR